MTIPFSPPLSIDEIKSRFPDEVEIINILTTGGQASLYILNYYGQQAVLKIYKDGYRIRAERECNVLEKIDSRNIIKLLDWGEILLRGNICIYTITEYVDGISLDKQINKTPLNENQCRKLGIDITKAIDILWKLDRIVHRDLKPENIIMCKDQSFVILDLGVARHRNLITVTHRGMVLGTEGYMSPEQWRGSRSLSYKSDFFALGITIYEAASQIHPFSRQQDLIGKYDPLSLNKIANVSEDLSNIIDLLLRKDPLDRPRDCSHLLKRFLGG